MASVGAASSPGRWRRQDLEAIHQSIQRAKAAELRSQYRARAKFAMQNLSSDGFLLDQALFKRFMEKTLDDDNLHKHALKMAKNTAIRRTPKQENQNGRFPLDALLDAVESYREYMLKRSLVEHTFKRYNRAGDGKLTKNELRRILQDQELRADRAAKGFAVTLIVSPRDLDSVMDDSSSSGNKIHRAELLPALESWERIAHEKMVQKQMASCGPGCIIL